MENIARTLALAVKRMVPGRFEVKRATPNTHPHVKWSAYGRVRRAAEALGFRHLGDVDPVSVWIDQSITKRVVMAMYVSKDGTEVLAHYRFVPIWTLKGFISRFLGASNDYFDAITNFGGGEGMSLATTNAAKAGYWLSPDFIQRQTLPAGTSLEQVVAMHRRRVAEFRAAHPEAAPMVVRELSEVVAASNEMERRKLEWRRAFGWATRQEIAAVTKLQGPALDEVFEEFKKKVAPDSRVAPLSNAPLADTPSAAPAAAAGLQFDRVDVGAAPAPEVKVASLPCGNCGRSIDEYFQVDGRSVCASCKDVAALASAPARGAGVYFKALLFGGVAALIGAAIYYGVIAITDFEIGLVALLIGFIVGAAVRTATDGRGGRRFQIMAVTLTYFAVGLAYAPLFIKGAMQSAQTDSSAVADTLTVAEDSAVGDSADISDSAEISLAGDTANAARVDSLLKQVSSPSGKATRAVLASLAAVSVGGFLMVFALPILAVLMTMPSGLISAMIIGIGMHQAWKMTAAQRHQISGPYRVGATPTPRSAA